MPDDASIDEQALTVVYTGTRAPTFEHPDLSVVHVPMLQTAPVEFDRERVQLLVREPCTLVFYSRNAVTTVAASGVLDGIPLDEHTIWAVGQKTADVIGETFGLNAHVPGDERFDGLIDEFRDNAPPRPIVAFSLKGSPRSLATRLADLGDVYDIPVYHTCPRLYPNLAGRLDELDADWIAFTSPRGVRTFVSQASSVDRGALRFAAIGPTTAEAMREAAVEPDLVMETPDKNLMMKEILTRRER